MRENACTSNESQLLQQCLQLVEEKTGWGPCADWTQNNFDRLSDHICEKSGISISSSTLRRLFSLLKNRSGEIHPQIATKNALSIYLGCSSWDEFVQLQRPARAVQLEKVTHPTFMKVRGLRLGLLAFGIVLLLCLVFLMFNRNAKHLSPVIEFSAQTVHNNPYHVSFDYNVSPQLANALKIDFGDGNIQILQESARQIIHHYRAPGIYSAKLFSRDSLISLVKVSTGTMGWTAAIAQHDTFYTIDTTVVQNGSLYVKPVSLEKNGVDINKPYWTFFRNVKDFGVSGDSFTGKIRVKNNEENGGIPCFDININFIGEHEQVFIEFFEPGCTVWADLKVSDVELDGKKEDLSNFGQPFKEWRIVTLQIENRNFKIFLDGKLIHTGRGYKKDIGNIKAATITFKGTGAVDYLRLFDSKGNLVVNENFEEPDPNTLNSLSSSR